MVAVLKERDMKLKEFNLEEAKAGAPIQTRDGRPAKFIAHVPEAVDDCKIVVLIEGIIHGWLNVYEDGNNTSYLTKEEADKHARVIRIACIPIEFVEGEGL